MKEDFRLLSKKLLYGIVILCMIFFALVIYVISNPTPDNLSRIEEGTRITGSLLGEMVNNSVKVVVKDDTRSFRLMTKDKIYFETSKSYIVYRVIYNTNGELLECYVEYKSK